MNIRAFALSVLLSTLSATASTISHSVDSVSNAVATMWGGYMRPQILRQFHNDTSAVNGFIAGIETAFSNTQKDIAYHLGVVEGSAVLERIEQMRKMGLAINDSLFLADLKECLLGNNGLFNSRTEAEKYLNSLVAPQSALDTVSLSSQKKFLLEQTKRSNVITTKSGLVFETIKKGSGTYPVDTDKVKMTYTGRLSDGAVFDSTEKPVVFDVSRLVPGFTEGLKLMQAGGKYRLFIPASLGYGNKGIEGVIPGNAVLDFEVHLLEILKQ